ncbi:MAG: hypothetical protein LBK99_09485 [Opitutaceae bacterium]|jgi:hypothetical protein|nr:hypothetical protein [Opitutaceae bacterium]
MNTCSRTSAIHLVAFLFAGLLPAQGALLFEEDWSSYDVGTNQATITGTTGNWIRAFSNSNEHFVIAAHPDSESFPAGKVLATKTSYTNPTNIPRITSRTDFTVEQGVKIEYSLSLNTATSGQLAIRIGLAQPKTGETSSFDSELYVSLNSTSIGFTGSGTAAPPSGTSWPSYTWEPGEFSLETFYNFTHEIVPVSEGVVRSTIYMGNKELLSYQYSLSGSFKAIISPRDASPAMVDACIDYIRVSSFVPIPESSATAAMILLGTGAGALAAAGKLRGQR